MTRSPRTGRYATQGTHVKIDQPSLFLRVERARRIDKRVKELFIQKENA